MTEPMRILHSVVLAEIVLLTGPMAAQAPTVQALYADALAKEKAVRTALADAQGVVSRAAQALGLSRQALYRRMERHGLGTESGSAGGR